MKINKLKKIITGAACMGFAVALAFSVSACYNNDDDESGIVENPVYGNEPLGDCSFRDEFSGNAVNPANWGYQEGDGTEYHNPGWGNNEQQYYRKENARVEDGYLKITAKITPEKDRGKYRNKKYTSCKLVTQNIFTQAYGRFEARIRLTKADEGLWPAFWLFPQDSEYGGWPRSGEIDIMELKGRFPGQASSAVQYRAGNDGYNAYDAKEYYFSQYTPEGEEDSDITDWHVYALEWTPEKMEFSVDGNVYHTVTPKTWHTGTMPEDSAADAPYDEDFFILLNFAVGGNFDGGRTPADDNMPIEMWVDYVRVYDLNYLTLQEEEENQNNGQE